MHFSCSRIATCSALRLFFYYYFLNFCCSLIATCSALRLLFIYLFCFLQPDRHLLGAETPPESPHVLIVESTYGVQLHETRAVREQRFTSAVHGIIRRGGRCLIPVFALGRAQELLLLLESHWERRLV